MSEEVVYEVSLKDFLSSKIKGMKESVNKFESSMHAATNSVSNFGTQMLETMGIAALFSDGFAFISKATEEFHNLEQARSQVEAGLESTGAVAGVTGSDLEAMAKKFSSSFQFTRAQITDMQAIMLTFPGVTKKTFGDASQAIIDLSTRMHKGLSESAVMVGKALQDPEKGVTALRKIGVNFNKTQTEIIKNLVATGHAGQAQARILTELQTEFAGSAAAAAAANPLFRFNKNIEELQLSVGSLVTGLKTHLAPVLELVAGAFKDVVGWLQRNKEWADLIVDVLLPVVGAVTAVVIATKLWAVAQTALNFALSNNPIGKVIIVIAAIAGAVIYAWTHFAKFRAVVTGVWGVLKAFATWAKDVFLHLMQGVGEMIQGAMHFDLGEMKKGWEDATYAFRSGGFSIADSFKKGYDEGMAGFTADHATVGSPKTIVKHSKGDAGADGNAGLMSKATGQKNIDIHITIQDLVKNFTVQTTNMIEGAKRVKEMVAEALTSAVNDSQIIAGE